MIEIRNNEIADKAGQLGWADRLAKILVAAEPRTVRASHAAA
jgi:predicted N-formylglutamate amidohydrolase